VLTTYPDSVRYLYSLGNEVRTIKLGLDRIQAFLSALGEPQKSFKSVHIAGTNGKGSVASMIASGLGAAGRRTGLYTSPHLVEPTERIQVAGRPVSRERFVDAFERVHQTAEQMHRKGELDAHPTYFETVTAMGFLLFHDLGVETAVVETGLGGRLDATNVLQPEMCVITRVDYDHERYLGNSIESIAGEKAGILKAGTPAVFGAQRPEAMAVLEARAAELGIFSIRSSIWGAANVEYSADGNRFAAERAGRQIAIEGRLAGEHQVENALTAVTALELLKVPESTISRGIADATWPGRLERVGERPEILLDGAHNPAGVRALAAHLRRFYADRRIWLVYGAMRDKSLDEIAGILSPLAYRVVLTSPETHRALRAEVLGRLFDDSAVVVAESVADALAAARAAGPEDLVVITGSLMLVGEARGLLVRSRDGRESG
jgi:dihydrofolate synthase / folylpolyglutamate synthase